MVYFWDYYNVKFPNKIKITFNHKYTLNPPSSKKKKKTN